MAVSGDIDHRLCAKLQSNKVQLVQNKKLKKTDAEDKHEHLLHGSCHTMLTWAILLSPRRQPNQSLSDW
jgi:hypothetical protein